METLNELLHRSKCLQKAVTDFKAMEYPDNCPAYYNLLRRGIILIAGRCHDLARALPRKDT